MRTLPISKFKDQLSELVDAASQTHEQVTITKNGVPAAILIGADEWEEIQETLFWLSQPGIVDDVVQAHTDIDTGAGLSEDEIRQQFGVPRK
ncbi:MAG: type II toxin-antitoxin system Phd/YefM family antitoxin [Candidatus Nanopelagicales bacterium]